MATRNLTAKFVAGRSGTIKQSPTKSRSDSGAGEESDGGLLSQRESDSTNWKLVRESLPPLWVDKIEKVEEDINKIQTKMRELSAIHTKRLMVNFETDEAQQEREIDIKTQEITELFRHAEGLLKKFGKQGDEATISSSELTVRKNMQSSIAKKLQGLSMSFRGSQKVSLYRSSSNMP